MGRKNTYQIPFVGLKDGVHLYEFVITDTFFESFGSSDISSCNLKTAITLHKVDQNNLTLSFNIKGWIKVTCDRCMVPLNEQIDKSYQVQIKLTDDENLLNIDEIDILYLPAKTTVLELDQLFYEYMHLSIPITSNCDDKNFKEKPCDSQILEFLNEESSKEKSADPRWAALEKLKK